METNKSLFSHRFDANTANIESAVVDAISIIVERSKAIASLLAPEISDHKTCSILLASVIDDLSMIDEIIVRFHLRTDFELDAKTTIGDQVTRLVERSKAVLWSMDGEFETRLITSVIFQAIVSDLNDIADILDIHMRGAAKDHAGFV
ncbi:MAG: hypothetical protein BVN35_20950 [Proteobacteria bacterium ST_bin11]|nr:MAG: hypothetical protein BVN35_20950 [Proteobacteria bacterium ST_bin11]